MRASNGISRNNRLRQARHQLNWRQQDLAEQLGTTVVTVKRWERGVQQPSAYFRIKLCTLFGKSAEELGLLAGNASPQANIQAHDSETGPDRSSLGEAPKIWMIPYRRNPHFTGRDEVLEEAIIASFQTLAAQLPGITAKDEQNQHKLIAAILGWLEQCPHPWLLIVDNADDLSLIQHYLPMQGRGSILLTTRAHVAATLAAPSKSN